MQYNALMQYNARRKDAKVLHPRLTMLQHGTASVLLRLTLGLLVCTVTIVGAAIAANVVLVDVYYKQVCCQSRPHSSPS